MHPCTRTQETNATIVPPSGSGDELLDSGFHHQYKAWLKRSVLERPGPDMPRKTLPPKAGPSTNQHAANLRKLRAQIDRLDREILKLINERARAAAQIGALKREGGMAFYSPAREE